ncbi:hypothetical protein BC827DRAFT_1274208 [Russula dissimulans]|nr:hypothetical protein BC827DRAFT_1274208 [Russula dissimulans]
MSGHPSSLPPRDPVTDPTINTPDIPGALPRESTIASAEASSSCFTLDDNGPIQPLPTFERFTNTVRKVSSTSVSALLSGITLVFSSPPNIPTVLRTPPLAPPQHPNTPIRHIPLPEYNFGEPLPPPDFNSHDQVDLPEPSEHVATQNYIILDLEIEGPSTLVSSPHHRQLNHSPTRSAPLNPFNTAPCIPAPTPANPPQNTYTTTQNTTMVQATQHFEPDMLPPYATSTPYFSGQLDQSIDEFLGEYEQLA